MRIIGITGRAGAGKDTVAEIILEAAPQRGDGRPWYGTCKREGFADRLKQSAAAALGYDGDDPIGFCNLLKEHGDVRTNIYRADHDIDRPRVTGRQYLQLYGTEAHRDVFGQDFWLDAVLPYSLDGETFCTRDDCDLLVIPDVRFPNEAQRVRDCGGEVWRIERPAADGEDAHPSEARLEDHLVGWTIWNTGTIDELRPMVEVGLGR